MPSWFNHYKALKHSLEGTEFVKQCMEAGGQKLMHETTIKATVIMGKTKFCDKLKRAINKGV